MFRPFSASEAALFRDEIRAVSLCVEVTVIITVVTAMLNTSIIPITIGSAWPAEGRADS